MILRVFLLFALAIVVALFCRAFLLRNRFKNDLKNEKAKMEEYLASVIAEHAAKAKKDAQNQEFKEVLPCAVCGVCLPEADGVRDENGQFFCSPVHLETFHKK